LLTPAMRRNGSSAAATSSSLSARFVCMIVSS
jgi:hypothetical protein